MSDTFNHEADAWDSLNDAYEEDEDRPLAMRAKCPSCACTDVRWRQQGGRWVLFDLQPGVEHVCPADELLKDFD